MIYDPNNREYYFSEEMILSEQGERQLKEQFRSFQTAPVAWFQNRLQVAPEDGPVKLIVMMIPAIAIFIGIIAAGLCIPVKRFDIMPWILAAVLVVPGVVTLLFPGTQGSSYESVATSIPAQRLAGSSLILGALALCIIRLTASDVTSIQYILTMFLAVSLTVFAFAAVSAVGMINSSKAIYSEEVIATVVGYLRTYEGDAGNDNTMATYTPTCSPVFEYYFDGKKYQSAYDVFYSGKDAKIPLGQSCPIRISPDHPERVQGNTKKMTSGPVAFALLGLAASVVLLILLLM